MTGQMAAVFWGDDRAADFAQSAIRDAVRELAPYLEHRERCEAYGPVLPHGNQCTCGLAALRQKFEVSE